MDMGVDIVGAGARLPPLIFDAFFADFRPDFLADFFALFLADPFFAPFFLADFFALADDFFLPAALAAPFFFLAMVIPKSHGVVKQKRTKRRPIMRACAVVGQRFLRSLAEERTRFFRLLASAAALLFSASPHYGKNSLENSPRTGRAAALFRTSTPPAVGPKKPTHYSATRQRVLKSQIIDPNRQVLNRMVNPT